MLAGSSLPHKLWGETLNTAVYLRNRIPTKALEVMTLLECFYGKKPNVDHLRVFKFACYAHIAKNERKKLDVVAQRCLLIGYDTEVKGYQLYDPDWDKVFLSRDVRFNKFEVGFKESSKVEPFSYVELEGSVDDSEDGSDVDTEVVGQVDDEEIDDEVDDKLAPRRSQRVRRRPNYY